ncbi:MAG: DUF3667 domain-containing protein [Bacteroidales bacterium]|nr:DUF3667 domain-containing protein [Bacteroidales bacterium]
MDTRKRHPIKARLRAFAIWQELGYLPWRKTAEAKTQKQSGDFYKGAFDSIPFLNDDAKRTFIHLLLRPGYMIRDYIRGDHERYLAPLTALIIFYAFFALVSAVVQPVQQLKQENAAIKIQDTPSDSLSKSLESIEDSPGDLDTLEHARAISLAKNTVLTIHKGWVYLHLDQYPEEVDTQHESSLAALEGALRSQGIPLFLRQFLLLWLAMAITLRRQKLRMSAYAAGSAYILCQFCFFMLFALLFSFGKSAKIGILLILALLVLDYHQWLGTRYTKSFWLAVRTGLWYGGMYTFFIILVGVTAFFVAWLRQ